MPSPILRNLNLLLAKVEAAYNTDPAPTKALDAVLVSGLQPAFPAQVIERAEMDPSLSPFAPVLGRKYGTMAFDVYLKGSGAAGTAPDWGPLLQACGFAETVNAGMSVVYQPASTGIKSVTLYAYFNGKLYVMTGCRGTVKFAFKAGELPVMSFVMTGHPVDDQDAALPTDPTYDATIPVPVVGSALTIDAYSSVFASLDLDAGNKVVVPDNANAADGYGEVIITDRTMQGSIDPEATLVATHDYWSEWEDGTQMALSVAVGAAAGNIATLTAPKLVYRELTVADRNNVMTHNLAFTAARNAGDDEIVLTMT